MENYQKDAVSSISSSPDMRMSSIEIFDGSVMMNEEDLQVIRMEDFCISSKGIESTQGEFSLQKLQSTACSLFINVDLLEIVDVPPLQSKQNEVLSRR